MKRRNFFKMLVGALASVPFVTAARDLFVFGETTTEYYGSALLKREFDTVDGFKLYVYEPGTYTAKMTYSDAAMTKPHPNPIILDEPISYKLGLPAVYVNGDYTMVLKDCEHNRAAFISHQSRSK